MRIKNSISIEIVHVDDMAMDELKFSAGKLIPILFLKLLYSADWQQSTN